MFHCWPVSSCILWFAMGFKSNSLACQRTTKIIEKNIYTQHIYIYIYIYIPTYINYYIQYMHSCIYSASSDFCLCNGHVLHASKCLFKHRRLEDYRCMRRKAITCRPLRKPRHPVALPAPSKDSATKIIKHFNKQIRFDKQTCTQTRPDIFIYI